MITIQEPFRPTTDAGGVIVRKMNGVIQVLLFEDDEYPNDWKLPKGHAEVGETLEQTARREIQEEVGVTKTHIHRLLGTFRRNVESRKEEKTIHYFLMTTDPDQPAIKPEPGTVKVDWFTIDQLPPIYLEEQRKVINDNKGKIAALFSNKP